MGVLYLFPGSFCPPTYGHLEVVRMALRVLPSLTIVCSRNPGKSYWFSEKECVKLWQAYDLPTNADVKTFEELVREGVPTGQVVMVRGLREPSDLVDEAQIMDYNFGKFGVSMYFYALAEGKFMDVSSTRARIAAENIDLEDLAKCVAPGVVTVLLERVLKIRNLYMVVGKSGGGKSTLLEMLIKDHRNYCVNTDEFSKALKPILAEAFPEKDLVEMALNEPEVLADVLGKPWLKLLSEALKKAPEGSNVFVEVAYGLRPANRVFRFLGSKIIYVGCPDEEHKKRILARGTPELQGFIEKIPGLQESQRIAAESKLKLIHIDSGGSLRDLEEKARQVLNKEGCYGELLHADRVGSLDR